MPSQLSSLLYYVIEIDGHSVGNISRIISSYADEMWIELETLSCIIVSALINCIQHCHCKLENEFIASIDSWN